MFPFIINLHIIIDILVRKYIILFEVFKKYHSKPVNKMFAESNFCCRFIYMRFNCFYPK